MSSRLKTTARKIVVALHGDVGELALRIAGACRGDLLAIAIDPRALAGSGVNTIVRVDLDEHGRARLHVNALATPLALGDRTLVVAVEPLRPLPDQAGYYEPRYRTRGDHERAESRDGFRRTP